MDSPELFIAFGAVMLVIALLAVAIDWFGKPMRHRKFVPKIYRFPDERQPRRSKVRATEWSETSFVLPVAESQATPLRYPEQSHEPAEIEPAPGQLLPADDHGGPPTAQVPTIAPDAPVSDESDALGRIVTLEDHLAAQGIDADADTLGQGSREILEEDPGDGTFAVDLDEHVGAAGRADGPDSPSHHPGWKPGDHVFKRTAAGAEPSAATVRSRYWKNVAAAGGASLFGTKNTRRMAEGKPPERFNPRTNKVEVMRLPATSLGDVGGDTPVPEWPAAEVDPFAAGGD